MKPKTQSQLILFALVAVVVLVVVRGLSQPRESFEEKCIRTCKPSIGVVERVGPELGRSWRPDQRNVVCSCK